MQMKIVQQRSKREIDRDRVIICPAREPRWCDNMTWGQNLFDQYKLMLHRDGREDKILVDILYFTM